MAVMTFHTEKCCRLAREHEAAAGIRSSARQFLIYSTLVLVLVQNLRVN